MKKMKWAAEMEEWEAETGLDKMLGESISGET